MKNATKTKSSAGAIVPSQILARDIMQTDVLTLRPDDSVESAITLLDEYHISGAPVVDATGRPLGVLTASDIARREHVQEGRLAVEGLGEMLDLGDEAEESNLEREISNLDGYSPEIIGRVCIRDWMTPSFVSVAPDATLLEICRCMLDESIHRVFIVEGRELRGVVSTYDLVRLLVAT
jgi:CBS domain-containing protein